MRFPSEKNKQKGNRDMGGDTELAVKHNTGQLGTGKDVGIRSPPAAVPAIHRKSWALYSGHTASVMQTAAAALARSSKRAAVPQRDLF